eukprot:CAMPEP_0178380126 /NCGR_PEP_ID=MMETSP0689_2-20121128/5298_1 /TAXON_ID=160604 /ORGANISM="Amphidinium massartii, Strain CS-259" /LENGTH=185 /DNA_ID=CAMNT_0020000251 /DNA_START=51 /DNA_END=604 /DNA_ORIENTATION=-
MTTSLALLVLGLLSGRVAADPIHQAARSNDVTQLAAIDKAALARDLNKQEAGSGQTPLMAATLAGAEKCVEFLLQQGADASIPEKDGYTPFHGAGFQGRAQVAKLLLGHGLNPSDRHKDGYTPLHRACWGKERRHAEMVRLLLQNGVDPEEASSSGKTCLEMTQNSQTQKLIKKRISRKNKAAGA